jgi:NAD-dependent deacetylase
VIPDDTEYDLSSLNVDRDSLIAVLTGAGVSAESGVPTFRGEQGMWEKHRPEDLATPGAFARDPRTVWEWYDYRRGICASREPNPAHRAISRLEEVFPRFLLITQNVDDLHRRSGSRSVVELHGNIFRVRCTRCGERTSNRQVPLSEIPPLCSCGGMLRPDVVWFGEALPEEALSRALGVSRSCDLMLVAGTSAVVQPAASMPLLAAQAGAKVVEVNPDPTPITPLVTMSLRGRAGEILPSVVDDLVGSAGY